MQKGLLSCGQTLLKVVYQTTAKTIHGKNIRKIMMNNKITEMIIVRELSLLMIIIT